MTYHKSDFTRIIILSILTFTLSLVGRSVTAQQVPHTFQNGQVIDADQMNDNFNYLSEIYKFFGVKKGTLNGEEVSFLIQPSIGARNIAVTSTGAILELNVVHQIVYTTPDCSGKPYLRYGPNIKSAIDRTIIIPDIDKLTYVNPKNGIFKLNVYSVRDQYSSSEDCWQSEQQVLALEIYDNEKIITGIDNQIPLQIKIENSEIFTVQDLTEGQNPSGNGNESYNVTLNGNLIGVTTGGIGANSFQVQLTDSDIQMSVNIYNGNINVNFWGYPQPDLYYLTSDCSGNGYYRVSDLAPLYAVNVYSKGLINQNHLYSLSEENLNQPVE